MERVAFVSSHAQLGGSERYLELLLGALGREQVAGVVCLQDGPFVARLREAGHRVDVVPAGARAGIVTGAWRLRRALRGLGADVVHANGVKAALVAVLATRPGGPPVVWVKHDFSWDGRLARALARGCALVVGVSEAVVAGLPGKVRVIPNGLPPLEADAERGRGVLGEGEVVLLLGRMGRVKGQLELVEAAPALVARRPDARIVLVGGEDANDPAERAYAAQVRARVEALGLTDRVRLLGPRDDALDLLAAADVAAVPSGPNAPGVRGEGFGLVALEAMAVGTPVVGWRAGALPEVVDGAGLLVSPGDRAGLATALADVLEDPARRARMAQDGLARAAQFTLDRVAAAMRLAYREAAGRPEPV